MTSDAPSPTATRGALGSGEPMTLDMRVIPADGGAPEPLQFKALLVVLGGYAARNADELERHVEELRKIGIDTPAHIPAFWAMSRHLLTTEGHIQVQGRHTSGEIEYALLFQGGRVYVAAASDHTDREFEVTSIPRSKQLCAKILSRDVVLLDDVRDGWDAGALYSDVLEPDGDWRPYQRAAMSAMLAPDDLIAACFGVDASVPDGTALLSGTVSLLDGVTRFRPAFRGGLTLPSAGLDLSIEYDVEVLPEQAELLGGSSR